MQNITISWICLRVVPPWWVKKQLLWSVSGSPGCSSVFRPGHEDRGEGQRWAEQIFPEEESIGGEHPWHHSSTACLESEITNLLLILIIVYIHALIVIWTLMITSDYSCMVRVPNKYMSYHERLHTVTIV